MRILSATAFVFGATIVIGVSQSLFVANAQVGTGAQVGSTGPAKSAPAKKPVKLDRRYAVTKGNWSAATISLFNTWSAWDDNPDRRISVYSPDRQKTIEVVGTDVTLHIGNQRFETGINNVSNHDAELGWAPDSTKFFVTWSESGELGPWHMQVYGVDQSGIHEFPKVEEPARKDFERRVRQMPIEPELNSPELKAVWDADEYCEPYHVIGGRWLNGSQQILLSVLVRNTSECRYMSEFNVYRVDAVTGKILERLTAKEGHKRFGGKYVPLIAP
jgi:hypothetical protein